LAFAGLPRFLGGSTAAAVAFAGLPRFLGVSVGFSSASLSSSTAAFLAGLPRFFGGSATSSVVLAGLPRFLVDGAEAEGAG